MEKFRTLLIDDEPLAISRLKRLLADHSEAIEIIGEAANGKEGLEKAETARPDLLFLDIEMPLMTGFEMLSKLTYMPTVVFATAFDQYAIKAFEENSIDYLLKPVEKDRLSRTIEKLLHLRREKPANLSTLNLTELLSRLNPRKEMHNITVKSGDKIIFIPVSDISFFRAEDKYVFLQTIDNRQYLTGHTLSSLEEKLPESFIRVSRSNIINSLKIKELEKYFNGKFLITMSDQKLSKIETGTAFHENLKRLLEL